MFEDKKWDKTFKNRLAKHYDELKWLYSELYHNDQQAFNYFCDMMDVRVLREEKPHAS